MKTQWIVLHQLANIFFLLDHPEQRKKKNFSGKIIFYRCPETRHRFFLRGGGRGEGKLVPTQETKENGET